MSDSNRPDLVKVSGMDRIAVLQAQQCPECQACYVRSCASFECLPVVEVFLEEGITDIEVRGPYLCLFTRCIHGMRLMTRATAEQNENVKLCTLE